MNIGISENIQTNRYTTGVSLGYAVDGNGLRRINLYTYNFLGTKAAFGGPLFSQLLEYYQLSQLLEKYGTPSKVLIYVTTDIPNPPKDFFISFILFWCMTPKASL